MHWHYSLKLPNNMSSFSFINYDDYGELFVEVVVAFVLHLFLDEDGGEGVGRSSSLLLLLFWRLLSFCFLSSRSLAFCLKLAILEALRESLDEDVSFSVLWFEGEVDSRELHSSLLVSPAICPLSLRCCWKNASASGDRACGPKDANALSLACWCWLWLL